LTPKREPVIKTLAKTKAKATNIDKTKIIDIAKVIIISFLLKGSSLLECSADQEISFKPKPLTQKA
jgi:hypothetical protein